MTLQRKSAANSVLDEGRSTGTTAACAAANLAQFEAKSAFMDQM